MLHTKRSPIIKTLVLWALLLLLSGGSAAYAQLGPAGIVKVSSQWSVTQAHVGDQRALAIVLDIVERYHVNPDAARTGEGLIPTSIEVGQLPAGLQVGQPQFPEPHPVKTALGEVLSYEGQTVIYLPVVVAPDAAAGAIELPIAVRYQACDDKACYPPKTESITATLEVVPLDTAINDGSATAALFDGFDPSSFATIGQAVAPAGSQSSSIVSNDFFGYRFELDASTWLGFVLVLLVAGIAGTLLNFTPCVLPVIPIKIMSLHQQAAHGDRRRTLAMGVVFSAGIVLCFVFLGSLVAGLTFGAQRWEWGEIFSLPAVSVGLAVVIIAMALGMFGLYSIRLPQKVYMFNPSHDTYTGNFAMGVLTAVLSTPCTGPMLGGAIAWAAKQPAYLGLATFAAMGVGMALPYLLLTANPKWIDHLPRTGPGSELVKQAMGLLLLAVAAFFLGPIIPGQWEWWLIAALVIAGVLWTIYRTVRITGRWGLRLGVAVPAILLSLGVVAMAKQFTAKGPIAWQPFSEQAFMQAQNEGKSVLLEFTADWCGNCKALELTVYRDMEVASYFQRPDYVAFQVDLTSQSNEVGWAWQRKLGAGGGIPLAAVYHAGSDEPTAKFQGLFTTGQLLEALEQP